MTMVADEGADTAGKAGTPSPERKLIALRQRLVEAQRALLMQAADASTIPSSNALQTIGALESAIVATETMIDEERGRR